MRKLKYKNIIFDTFEIRYDYEIDPRESPEENTYVCANEENTDPIDYYIEKGADCFIYVCPDCVEKYNLYTEIGSTNNISAEIEKNIDPEGIVQHCGIENCSNETLIIMDIDLAEAELIDGNDDDEYKRYVNDIFENIDNVIKIGTNKIKKPMPFKKKDQTQALGEFCTEKAYEELEAIRESFITFQTDMEDLALSEFFVPALESFAIFAASISQVLDDEYSDSLETISPSSKKKLSDLKKLRAEILSAVYARYKDEE